MAYDKNTWVDQQVQRPKTYQVTNNDDGSITLIDHFGNVTELGTPVNADHMNYIENGIANTTRKYSITETFNNGEIVQGTVDGETDFYKSKVAENLGNALTDTNSWEKASFGGRGGSGFNLFDLVLKDHILSYEESEGFALQGTYVYKEPVAGSRYGYPDFYNKCVEEYQNTNNEDGVIHKNFVQPVLTANGELGGNSFAVAASSEYSTSYMAWNAFDSTNSTTWSSLGNALPCYITFYNPEPLNVTSLKLTNKENTEAFVTGKVYGSNDNNGWEVLATFTNPSPSVANAEWEVSLKSNEKYFKYYRISADTTQGTNVGFANIAITANEYLCTCKKNPNGHIFYDIADKDVVDELYEQRGEAWFYGVDTENERVFLPRAVSSALRGNCKNISVIGNGMSLGMTNGTTNCAMTGSSEWINVTIPMVKLYGPTYGSPVGTNGENRNPIVGTIGVVEDPAKSGIVIDPQSMAESNVDMYVYIVVGNTTQQSGVTDVVDITTTENDTLPLFTPQYFDFEPNHPSWLKAGTQANYGDIYTTAYNELVNALTNNPQNILVVDSSEMEPDNDYSEYWIVYQDTMTFRTPLRLPASPLANNAGCKGNGIAIGATNGTANAGLTVGGANPYTSLMAQYYLGAYGEVVGTDVSAAAAFTNGEAIGLTTDTEKSGIIVDTSNQPLNLYFKVANAVQNLELLDVGEVMETLADKVDMTNTPWAVSACMPDYSAGISVIGYTGTSNQFTAPCDGMIIFSGTLGGQAYLNNTLYADYQSGTASAGNNFNIFISKNDTFYYNSTVKGDGLAMKFYPLKGANQ